MVDVSDLKDFYRSSYGKTVRSAIVKLLKELIPEKNLSKRIFVGFGTPYTAQPANDLLLMLAHMGIYAWPTQEDNRATLSYENEWPFADQEFDEIILLHGLEYSQNSNALIHECQRCLKPEGKLIVITPNRRSVWAHTDRTPLGFGQPYSVTQLATMLNKNGFMLTKYKRALYKLPFASLYGKLLSTLFEAIAKRCLQKFSGLIGVVAIKQVYSGIPLRKYSKVIKPVAVPQTSGI
jgi:SAM-dependent methyltransferase